MTDTREREERATAEASRPAPADGGRRRGNPFRRRQDDGPRATLGQLLPYLAEHRRVLLVVVGLSILGAAASLAQPLLVGLVIRTVQASQPLGAIVWGLVALVVVSGLLSGVTHFLLQRTGEGVVLSSRRRLVARMLNLPISEFDARRTGDLVSRVGSDTTLLRAVLTQGGVEAIGGAVTFVGALIAMLVIDPLLLGLTALVIAVSVVTVVTLSARIRVASREAQDQVGALAAAVERAIGSIRTVRAANATDREIAGIDVAATGAWRKGITVARISALVVPVAGIAMQVSFLVVLGVGGYRVASGAISIAQLVAFILFLFMLILPLGQAFGALNAINSALGALGRIQEIVETPAEDADDRSLAPDEAIVVGPANAGGAPAAPALEFDHVSFAYPDRSVRAAADRDGEGAVPEIPRDDARDGMRGTPARREDAAVLDDVSFLVPRGARVALVGPSGAGKSTTFALLERFYDPTSGAVRLGGLDIRALERRSLRSQLGYVQQDAPVLAGTLRQNLLLAAPDATDDECREVLAAVNLSDVLGRDPAGLDAQVGEDGVRLSGGERQRLAIGRALLAAPPILLLDESTSSLDGVNEQLMREAIDAVAAERTLVVIAHRLSTVVDSDLIVVLESGGVIGIGTHSDLVERVPLYRDLAKHQLLV